MTVKRIQDCLYVSPPNMWQKPFSSKLPVVFLAGTCADGNKWRRAVVDELVASGFRGTVIDPFKTNYGSSLPDLRKQTFWEQRHMQQADAIVFFFGAESECPISLLELGLYLHSDKKIFIRVNPAYRKIRELDSHLSVAKPLLQATISIESLVEDIMEWADPY